ncbi:MerC domain-containing protein [Haloarchaeobius sp. DFWS5]|uniref:MerC domain-containing protein n=1 Tax=Haloarchaeobius sp. DFWS5 TaxID=3446114 RepID=UPI003EB6F554
MRRKSIVLFAVVASFLIVSHAPIVAADPGLVVGSEHSSESDFTNASLTNMSVSGSGESASVVLNPPAAGGFSDDYEDGSVDGYIGETGSFGTYTGNAYSGTYGISRTGNDGAHGGVLTNTDLWAGGDQKTASIWMYWPGQNNAPNRRGGVYLADSSGDGLVAFWDQDSSKSGDDKAILRFDEVSSPTTYEATAVESSDTPLSAGYYKVVITHDGGSSYEAWLEDTNGNTVIGPISKTDSSFTPTRAGVWFYDSDVEADLLETNSDLGATGEFTTGTYLSPEHSVENAEQADINISDVSNVSADLSVEYHDGSSWQTGASTTVGSAGNYSLSLPDVSSSRWRVRVDVSKTGESPEFRLLEESILFDSSAPSVEAASVVPPAGSSTNNENVNLSIPVSDSDFGTAQGDSVTVEIYVDGNLTDTQAINSNQTVSTTVAVLSNGSHSWHVDLSDSYGETVSSQSFSFDVLHHPASLNNSSAIPQNGSKVTERDFNLSISLTDTDFDEPSGDENVVDFYVDGSLAGSETVSENGTVSLPVSVSTGGSHTWHVEVTDEYGFTTESESFTFDTPNTLYIRNELNPDQLINESVSITVRLFGNETTQRREVTDGTLNLTGIPFGERIVATTEAEGWVDRRIIIRDLGQQQDIYLLDENATTVPLTFELTDKSGNFPTSESVLIIQKALNVSGSESLVWRTIAGDDFAADETFPVTLAYQERYRILVRNEDGDERNLGSFIPTEGGRRVLTIGSVSWQPPEGDSVLFNVTHDKPANVVKVAVDGDESFDSLRVLLYERGNRSAPVFDATSYDVDQYWEMVPYGNNTTEDKLVVEAIGKRDGEVVFNGSEQLGSVNEEPIDIDQNWLALFVQITVVGVIGLVAGNMHRTGGIIVVAVAFGVTWFGWFTFHPASLGISGVIALFAATRPNGGGV